MKNSICPNCGKPYYQYTGSTVTLTSTVWPYCQCAYMYTMISGITTGFGEVTLVAGEQGLEIIYDKPHITPDIPKVFQDAFKDEDLQP